ncbi:hypothetical protein HNR46_000876 [Haloferula luteola]|uniref:Laccase domain-containing protein n=1 Tax=Haloferula luteola TaxID=595692 RepID=A0A840V7D1_9BACT|nr:hypothetical protein [Haloferula luteola]
MRAGWVERVAGIDVVTERAEVLRRLMPVHRIEAERQVGSAHWWRAEQVHGNELAVVPGAATCEGEDGEPVVPGVDGLLCAEPGEVLGIYVADCGAIWLADRRLGAVGLLHSGKKGTEGEILVRAVARMKEAFGCEPEDLVAVLSPCIRPPHYEVDIAAEIGRQAVAAGIGSYFDCWCDTAADRERYYSYRMEKGQTGRMLALIRCGGSA